MVKKELNSVCVCSLFRIVFVPTSLASLPPRVMLQMHRGTATNLEIAPSISKECTKNVLSENELIEV